MIDTPTLIAMILDVADRHPDEVNPRVNGVCVYDAGNAQPGVKDADRCVFGRLAFEQGWAVPGSDAELNARDAAGEYDWPLDYNARCVATDLQNVFDGLGDPDGPKRWADAAAFIRNHYGEEA